MKAYSSFSQLCYIPFQPGFENKKQYQNFTVLKEHPLYGIVSDFYQFYANGKNDREICVIPDGCMDFLFKYCRNRTEFSLEGFHREKIILPIEEEGYAFGVRFMPGALSHLFKVNAVGLVASHTSLYDFLGNESCLHKMEEAGDFETRIAIMADYLVKRKRERCCSYEIVRYCTERIIENKGNISIKELADETGYSIRYLRNLYSKYVGISPKELSVIIQFQNSFFNLSHLEVNKSRYSLCDIAMHFGYYDQSHMYRTYLKISGCSPLKLYGEVNDGNTVT